MRHGRAVGSLATACMGLALGALRCTPDVELIRAPGATRSTAPHWTAVASGTTRDLHAIWGTGPNDVWTVGDAGTVIRWTGDAWRDVPSGVTDSLNGVWESRVDDAWIVGSTPEGNAVFLHWEGARWAASPTPPRAHSSVRAIWGTSSGNVWAVGGGFDAPEVSMWHWEGVAWRPEFMPGGRPQNLASVRGNGPDNVWAVGEGPTILHRNAGGWVAGPMPPRSAAFGGAVCVVSDGTVWAAGSMNTVWRYADANWTAFPLDSMTTLRSLWCGRVDDVWAVGDGDRAAHWNGSSWSFQPVPRANLAALWGTGSGELWAVGAQGAVLRYGP